MVAMRQSLTKTPVQNLLTQLQSLNHYYTLQNNTSWELHSVTVTMTWSPSKKYTKPNIVSENFVLQWQTEKWPKNSQISYKGSKFFEIGILATLVWHSLYVIIL